MKIATIVGARPQFIKAAAVSRAVSKSNNNSQTSDHIKEIIIHTGQHFDKNMSDIFFEELEIPKPDYLLDIHGLSHGAMTGQMMEKNEDVLLAEKPDTVLVYGDTNSTLAGALAASKLHIPVAHVEAGLRSFNRRMPEEINRVVADHVSTILFCPTETAVNNLKKEGLHNIANPINRITSNNPAVINVGDVMYDSVLFYSGKAEKDLNILGKLKIQPKGYGLVTIHRAENTEDIERLEQILKGLTEISKDLLLVWPMHPRVKNYIKKLNFTFKHNRLKVIDPVGYLDIVNLEKNAKTIFTDSGGIQKEAYFFQVPCITLRDETEWIETVESGFNVLTGADERKILDAYYNLPAVEILNPQNFFGDGHASEKIVGIMVDFIKSLGR